MEAAIFRKALLLTKQGNHVAQNVDTPGKEVAD